MASCNFWRFCVVTAKTSDIVGIHNFQIQIYSKISILREKIPGTWCVLKRSKKTNLTFVSHFNASRAVKLKILDFRRNWNFLKFSKFLTFWLCAWCPHYKIARHLCWKLRVEAFAVYLMGLWRHLDRKNEIWRIMNRNRKNHVFFVFLAEFCHSSTQGFTKCDFQGEIKLISKNYPRT